MKEFIKAFKLSKRLLARQKMPLYVLLITMLIFQIEAPLVLPLLLKEIFYSITEMNGERLNAVILLGLILFGINVMIMYFVNVYGDPWVTKFVFKAAENTFKEISKMPAGTIENNYKKDDLFNRIAAGTGNVTGIYFKIVDILGNIGAIIAVLIIIADVSYEMFILALIIIGLQVFRMWLQYKVSYKINMRIQESKTACIRYIRTFIFNNEFVQMNYIVDLVYKYYIKSRKKWYHWQLWGVNAQGAFHSVGDLFSGFYKMFLISTIFMEAQQVKSYLYNITALFSTFDTIAVRANLTGNKIASIPSAMVPVNRLDEIFVYKSNRFVKENKSFYIFKNINLIVDNKSILQNISLKIPRFSKIAIVGENGSGKTTLLKVIAGLCGDPSIITNMANEKICYMPSDDLLFQSHLVIDNILYCARTSSGIKQALERVGINKVDSFILNKAGEISGGEAKRVNFIRSFLSEKEIILADEPTRSLDTQTADVVMDQLLKEDQRTCIYVTHSPKWARMADEIWIMRDGRIYKQLSKKEAETDMDLLRFFQKEGKNK